MSVEDFLSQLNTAQKNWGLWLNRDNGQDYHVGHYAFEHDQMPKHFIHVDNLDHLAHLRQQYIWSNILEQTNEALLGQRWAENFLDQWRTQNCQCLV